LSSFALDQTASFAAACATRLAPIFTAFSRTGGNSFDAWLHELWWLVGSPDTARAQALATQVSESAEAHLDDSDRPDFYAMVVLSVLDYAVQVLLDEDSLSAAQRRSRAAISLLRDFDHILQTSSGSAGSLVDL